MNLGEKIKKLRKSKGVTQIEFAKIFNISNGAIALWETNKRQPDYDMLIKIADFFNVSIDYLLDREWGKETKTTKEQTLTDNEKRLLQIYNNLIPPLQEYALETLENLDKKSNINKEKLYK